MIRIPFMIATCSFSLHFFLISPVVISPFFPAPGNEWSEWRWHMEVKEVYYDL